MEWLLIWSGNRKQKCVYRHGYQGPSWLFIRVCRSCFILCATVAWRKTIIIIIILALFGCTWTNTSVALLLCFCYGSCPGSVCCSVTLQVVIQPLTKSNRTESWKSPWIESSFNPGSTFVFFFFYMKIYAFSLPLKISQMCGDSCTRGWSEFCIRLKSISQHFPIKL